MNDRAVSNPAPCAVVVLLGQGLTMAGWVRPSLLPSPVDVLRAGIRLGARGES